MVKDKYWTNVTLHPKTFGTMTHPNRAVWRCGIWQIPTHFIWSFWRKCHSLCLTSSKKFMLPWVLDKLPFKVKKMIIEQKMHLWDKCHGYKIMLEHVYIRVRDNESPPPPSQTHLNLPYIKSGNNFWNFKDFLQF